MWAPKSCCNVKQLWSLTDWFWTRHWQACSVVSALFFFLHCILVTFLRNEATFAFSVLLAHKYSQSHLCLLATTEIPFPYHILFSDFIDLLYQTSITYDWTLDYVRCWFISSWCPFSFCWPKQYVQMPNSFFSFDQFHSDFFLQDHLFYILLCLNYSRNSFSYNTKMKKRVWKWRYFEIRV